MNLPIVAGEPCTLTITAGTGPVEVRQFVALLGDRVVAFCEERGAVIKEVVTFGKEDEPSSIQIGLTAAPVGIGTICGTHALVARSSFRAKNARKRWYAAVALGEVQPDISNRNGGARMDVRRDEVIVTAMRAPGPGGQHVNKTSSAVRVEHPPSGIVVRISSERSQRENLRIALERIAEIAALRQAQKRRKAKAEHRLLHYRVERGNPAFVYELGRKGELCETTCSK
ncbi:MAG: peptide chain release factor-like protein [Polyangiaceae bacterium]|nr:peptide chain release factor-like protein [Polyangiaceae bacterium]